MCPEVDSDSESEYHGIKAAGAYGWRPTTLVVPKVEMSRGFNLPGTPWATSACRGTPLLFKLLCATGRIMSMEITNDTVFYCHPWSVRFYYIFPHYLKNCTIFGKKLLNTKCVFWFSVQLLSETFLILRRTERDMIKNVYRYACKVPVIVGRF